MIIEILMPALSPTMTDGTLTKWIKKEGEKVKPGEVIAEIETDKATMEVEAVDEGIIGKILVEAGTNNVAVGKAIALVLEEESDRSTLENYQLKGSEKANLEKAQEQPKNETNSKIPQIQKNNDLDRIFASPLAKRIAEQKSVNLKNIEGSGPHGRIVKADVLTASSKPQALGTAQIASKGGYRLEPLSNMRKVIAKRLLESKQTVPHFYLSVDCNLDKLLEMRIEVNSSKDAKHKISVNDFIIKSCAASLAKIPEANSSWSDEGIIHYDDVDIAVAVAIEGGLITPLVRKANLKTLSEISEEMRELASRAREGKLKPEEYQGGGFSISNLGMYGIKQFSAIVNPPQSCILAVGAGIKTPVVIGDAIKVSTVAQVTLSCDHRVVDGAVAAKFLSALKDFIENPIKMLV